MRSRESRGRSDSAGTDPGRRPPLTLRHPKAVLAIAALVLVAFGMIGTGVEEKLEPTTLNIPGTESSRSNELLREHFGAAMPFAILLQGPAAAIDRQGPELIRALRQDPEVTTISPWDRGSVVNLRPSPRRALILADFHNEIKEAVNESVPQLEQTIEEEIHAPVRATQTGFASISAALQERSIAASERGELIAFPFLLIVLLLVFRSPIAAAIPLAFGAVTVVASRGILYMATSWFDIDAFALTVCSMMGLALGVDYALLMVSRFREELAAGLDPKEAARVTRRTAGRTTLFAGSTLLLSMLVSIFILPGSLLASLAGTLVMVVILTVVISTVLAPAVLVLLGHNVNRWRIGSAPNGRSRLMTVVTAALKRPVLASVLIGGVVLLLAAPAIGLQTGPPSPEQLPKDDQARKDNELIARVMAPGYEPLTRSSPPPTKAPSPTRNTSTRSIASSTGWPSCPACRRWSAPARSRTGRAAEGNRQRDLRLRRQHRPGQTAGPARSQPRRRRRRSRAVAGRHLRSKRRRRPARPGLRPGRGGSADDRQRAGPGGQGSQRATRRWISSRAAPSAFMKPRGSRHRRLAAEARGARPRRAESADQRREPLPQGGKVPGREREHDAATAAGRRRKSPTSSSKPPSPSCRR